MDDTPVGLALDRLRFGANRTLNLRAGLPSGAEAAMRADAWLRSKQVEVSGEVLVITGRGRNSLGGVPVVRDATRRVLNNLRRAGVVSSYGEDTPGSFVVTLAPLRALLEAAARRPRANGPLVPVGTLTIAGLRPESNALLRQLATRSMDALGVQNATPEMLSSEMQRQFSLLARAVPAGADPDAWISNAIAKVSREIDDGR